ncbi:hypothetical protein A3Q56_06001 [Intoshia linei]|uniref:Uncharacterized protein n=1 Tax=Intoshia linei TaxID=1819745 RepID=A0A177AYL5_9BILA|nr:hypothetical protein A3Q56_06001 [Intoshia linei]
MDANSWLKNFKKFWENIQQHCKKMTYQKPRYSEQTGSIARSILNIETKNIKAELLSATVIKHIIGTWSSINTISARIEMSCMRMLNNEDIDQYVHRIRIQANKCNFSSEEESIRDHIAIHCTKKHFNGYNKIEESFHIKCYISVQQRRKHT